MSDVTERYIKQLIGKTITHIVKDAHPDTLREFGEPYYGLGFSDGTEAWILCDPEGNGPGFLDIVKEGNVRQ